jgi:hypothetical protein
VTNLETADLVNLAALVLFLAPVPGWVATVILLAAALRKPRIAALTERAFAAVILSGAASAAAYLASARLGLRDVDNGLAVLLLIAICIAVSIPSLVWLSTFLKGGFGRSDE